MEFVGNKFRHALLLLIINSMSGVITGELSWQRSLNFTVGFKLADAKSKALNKNRASKKSVNSIFIRYFSDML
ncbi:hypothetical protein CWB81_12455 [Pseudoalteromonas sp. S1688]|nr:hypothetical protein CWB81_12455 [Pseudoalteromonas sp. S1688]